MPEEAVLEPISAEVSADASYEAPIESTPDVDASPEVDGTEPVEGAEGAERQPQTEAEKATSQKPVYDQESKKLDPEVKAELDKLRETKPVLAARIRNSLAQGEALRAVLPGGVKEAQQLKSTFEDLGGEEGIQEIRTYNQEFDALRASYNEANPAFIEEMIKSNEDSFLKLAPSVFDKFYQMDQDGYSAYVSKVFFADMKENDVLFHMTLLARSAAAQDPSAKESLDAINAYIARIKGNAQKPVNTPRQPKAQDTREVELNAEKMRFEAQKYQDFEAQETDRTFQSSLSKLVGDRKVSAEDQATIKELFRAKMRLQLGTVQRFQENRTKYFNARDSNAHQRYIRSTFSDLVPKAVKYAVERTLKPAAPVNGQRPAAAPQKPGLPNRPAPNSKDQSGVTWVGKAPVQAEMDPRTSPEMYKSGKAILSNGKVVRWR